MNHYDVLGVKKNASQDEIKKSYKDLVKKYHPDIYAGDKAFAEKKTQEINEAYSVLSNEESRKLYDEEINPTPVYQYTEPTPNNTNKNSGSGYDYYKQKYYEKYGSYDPTKRYADFHKNKTPYSSYADQRTDNSFAENIIKILEKKHITLGLKHFIIIFIIYLLLFAFCVNNIYKIITLGSKRHNESSYVEEDENDTSRKLPDSDSSQDQPAKDADYYFNLYKSEHEEQFDIYAYYSESELRYLYEVTGSLYYDSYEEFKEVISRAFIMRYYPYLDQIKEAQEEAKQEEQKQQEITPEEKKIEITPSVQESEESSEPSGSILDQLFNN